MTTNFLLIEGFDVYPDISATSQGAQAVWLANNYYLTESLAAGRYGGQALKSTHGSLNPAGLAYALYPALAGNAALCFGVAINLNIPITQIQILSMKNNGPTGTAVFGVGLTASQELCLWVGSMSNRVATMAASISTGSWHYLEVLWTGSPTVGTLSLYLDGLLALTFTGNTGSLTVDTFCTELPTGPNDSNYVLYDDIYVTDTAVRVGEARVETKYATSNDAVQWAPLAGTNWQEISETLCDGDSSYNSSVTPGQQDTFNMQALSTNALAIYAVQVRTAVRKTDATSHTIKNVIKSGGTTGVGATDAVAGSYLYNRDIFVNDPNTASAWTYTTVNSAKPGYNLVS